MATAYRSFINDIKALHDQIYELQMIVIFALKLMAGGFSVKIHLHYSRHTKIQPKCE